MTSEPDSQVSIEMIGQKFDHYEIERKLGEGGMGQVYLAKDWKLSRQVAIKLLRPQFSSDRKSLRRFEQEARSVSVLNHPNIVTIHDVGNVSGAPFIVMELVEGQSLRALIDQGPLPLRMVLKLAAQTADGLAKAHSAGVVHRDLKPENVMVTKEGFVKLLDFGLAKLFPQSMLFESMQTMEVTHPGTVVGTLRYMSPEQASGQEVDFRSDQFSLGLMSYEMATGKNPFLRQSAAQTLTAIIEEPQEPMRNLNPEIPVAFQGIVERCLAKSPARRFDTTSELAAALEEVRDRMTASSATATAARPSRRFWPLAAVGLIAAAAFAVYEIVSGKPPSDPASRDTPLPAAEGNWVLIADFDNQTAEDVFDESLQRAFAIGIGQSQAIRVLPPSRIEGALKRMRRSGLDRLEETSAREIAQREGASLVVLPSIAGVGGSYVLTASIQDPSSGASVSSRMVRAESREKVLDALDQLVVQVRGMLGETASAVAQTSKPLAEVTTPSLEALREYSLGLESFKQWRLEEARLHYENALELDPDFTAARASLGMLLVEQFDSEKGKELIQQAVTKLDAVTQRERLGILAFHARAVENDPSRAIEYLRARASSFPDDVATHHTLGWFFYQRGQFEDSAASLKTAIQVDPYFMVSYNLLGWIYLYEWGDMASALALAQEQIAHDDTNPQAFDNLGAAYLGYRDWDRAEEAFRRALEIEPDFPHSRSRLGHLYRIQGRYGDSIAMFERVLEYPYRERADAEMQELLRSAHYAAGIACELDGKKDGARASFERFWAEIRTLLEREPDRAVHNFEAAIVLSRLGEAERASAMATKALAANEKDLLFDSARWFAVQGQSQEAIDRLTRAVEEGYGNFIWMSIHPDFEDLYDDPRFQALLERGLKI